ncbi:microcin C ABC transporter permease YejB [Parendozoicomonas haliclonae]|uniref:Inner membrane ABC transporter permease protein YejB n=1 Tax=Parendozoicomonas haliclonae TaxID=1960125 RepID=A0A1X7ALW6_9GAMM|nr:microcin C ABC transporter permease YejB [Parendozoicomonas haliclonae]SMA49142.1 Inner membrane ABC transporter permease protein YejB [Parendozoicomonas haliclonae]
MINYIGRRLLLLIPTLLGILLLNFIIVQAAPGGPVEQMIAKLEGFDTSATSRIGGSMGETSLEASQFNEYQGTRGLSPELIAQIEKRYGFDRPAHERFLKMLTEYLSFDLGQSFYRSIDVTDLILEKLPVSISLGLWSTLIVYLISIPLGIVKATRQGSRLDRLTSLIITAGYAVPGFLMAMILVVLFAGGSWWQWFPLRGLTSDNFDELPLWQQMGDYLWHMVLPVTAMIIGSFATLTLLTRNSFLEEIRRQYVITARAKGLNERQILFGHVFRNAMLLVISSFPAALIGILFTNSLLIEIIFSLDGLGLLGFEAVIQRDYPVIFGTLYIFTLIGLIIKLIGDLTYVLVDPRIHFESGASR